MLVVSERELYAPFFIFLEVVEKVKFSVLYLIWSYV